MNNLQQARSFRPADPREYDQAQAKLAAHGRTIGDYLTAALRWFNRDPETALDTLAPDWPPPRITGRRALLTAYAVRDTDGNWLNESSLGLTESFQDCPMAYPFRPSDPYNPLSNQRLTLRCGEVTDEELVTPYAVRVLIGEREIAVRITHDAQSVLFGPAIVGTPEWLDWQDRREARRKLIEESVRYHELITVREILTMPAGGRRADLGRVHALNAEADRILCGWNGQYDPDPDAPWWGPLKDERCPECRIVANDLRAARG